MATHFNDNGSASPSTGTAALVRTPRRALDPNKTGDLSLASRRAASAGSASRAGARTGRDGARDMGSRGADGSQGVAGAPGAASSHASRGRSFGSSRAGRRSGGAGSAAGRSGRAGNPGVSGVRDREHVDAQGPVVFPARTARLGRTGASVRGPRPVTEHKVSKLASIAVAPFVALASLFTKRSTNRAAAGKSAAQQTDFMKYASDNRFIRFFYALTTGPRRFVFYLLVITLVGVGLYLPIRDFYVAYRTQDILEQQVAIRKKYNEALTDEVDSYLSQEGIEDAARKKLGMVMPGEQTITVEGLDENGNPVTEGAGSSSGDSSDSASGQDASAGSQDASGSADGADASGGAKTDASSDGGTSADSGSDSSDASGGTLKGSDAADASKTGSNTDAAASGKDPSTSAEVEAAQRAVYENSAWYWKVLDKVFFFDGANGMAVVSTGDAS